MFSPGEADIQSLASSKQCYSIYLLYISASNREKRRRGDGQCYPNNWMRRMHEDLRKKLLIEEAKWLQQPETESTTTRRVRAFLEAEEERRVSLDVLPPRWAQGTLLCAPITPEASNLSSYGPQVTRLSLSLERNLFIAASQLPKTETCIV